MYILSLPPVSAESSLHLPRLRNLCQYLGIEAEETMAFGDGENDWPMLEAAGIGVAMENGAPFLKERADRIAASNREEGVAEAIRQWVLI